MVQLVFVAKVWNYCEAQWSICQWVRYLSVLTQEKVESETSSEPTETVSWKIHRKFLPICDCWCLMEFYPLMVIVLLTVYSASSIHKNTESIMLCKFHVLNSGQVNEMELCLWVVAAVLCADLHVMLMDCSPVVTADCWVSLQLKIIWSHWWKNGSSMKLCIVQKRATCS